MAISVLGCIVFFLQVFQNPSKKKFGAAQGRENFFLISRGSRSMLLRKIFQMEPLRLAKNALTLGGGRGGGRVLIW